DDLERFHRIAADVASHRILADALDMGLRPDSVAGRAARGDVGIAEAEPRRRTIVPGGGRDRGHGDVANADGHAIPDFRADNQDGLRHFMAAAQTWGDHRPPAAGRRIRDNGSAILDRAEHRAIRIQHAVCEAIYDDAPPGRTFFLASVSHARLPGC